MNDAVMRPDPLRLNPFATGLVATAAPVGTIPPGPAASAPPGAVRRRFCAAEAAINPVAEACVAAVVAQALGS